MEHDHGDAGCLTAVTDWERTVDHLGGAERIERLAREMGVFQRARAVKCATDLLRLTLAYCLGKDGLRLTVAWAAMAGLANLSNEALLGRLRKVAPLLEVLVAQLLVRAMATRGDAAAAAASDGIVRHRLIRLVDATTVVKAGRKARENGCVWRIHGVLDLPTGASDSSRIERFSHFELTDEKGAERLDRAAVVAGEIRIADRIHCRVAEIAHVVAEGGDVVVRAGSRSVRWCGEDGTPIDVISLLRDSVSGRIDRSIWLARDGSSPLPVRLVALKMPSLQAAKAVADARKQAKNRQSEIQPETLVAAEWVILVTSLPADEYDGDTVHELYRLRWRIEIAFKRMKSIVGLEPPPGECPLVAKAFVLSHLIAMLVTEAELSALGASPRLGPHSPQTRRARAPISGVPSAPS
jgi:hypothetical protein